MGKRVKLERIMSAERIMKMSEIEIFNICRENNYMFPSGFWSVNTCKIILKHLYDSNQITKEELIKYGFRKVIKKFNSSTFEKITGSNTVECFKYMVNDDIKIWELPQQPDGYWDNHDNVKEYLLWYCEQQGWSEDEISKKFRISNINKNLFNKYNVKDIVEITFGDKYVLYDFHLPTNFWSSEDNVKEYVRYVIEKKYKLLTFDDIVNNIRTDMFKNLPLVKYGGLFGLLDITYPGVFHKWHFGFPKIYSLSEVKEYMLWYIKNILKLSDDELLEKLDRQMIPPHLLSKFTSKQIMDATFKPKYYIWDFKKFKTLWTSQTDIVEEHIEWLALRNHMTIKELSEKRTKIIKPQKYKNYNTYKKLLVTLDSMVG